MKARADRTEKEWQHETKTPKFDWSCPMEGHKRIRNILDYKILFLQCEPGISSPQCNAAWRSTLLANRMERMVGLGWDRVKNRPLRRTTRNFRSPFPLPIIQSNWWCAMHCLNVKSSYPWMNILINCNLVTNGTV